MKEILADGTLIRLNEEGVWIASVALEEYNPNQDRYVWQNVVGEKKYTFLQANGKSREEAICNLHAVAWDMMNKSGDEIVRLTKEIDTIKSRNVKLGCWLEGTLKGEILEK